MSPKFDTIPSSLILIACRIFFPLALAFRSTAFYWSCQSNFLHIGPCFLRADYVPCFVVATDPVSFRSSPLFFCGSLYASVHFSSRERPILFHSWNKRVKFFFTFARKRSNFSSRHRLALASALFLSISSHPPFHFSLRSPFTAVQFFLSLTLRVHEFFLIMFSSVSTSVQMSPCS